ncbi:MAG: glycosyltransferase [Planctomycetes bacterium]|nr:glycosyltransferase [Planctomycetota bacterium]
MNDNPLLSVIIPTYNCAPYVAMAVTTALSQSYTPLEVVVVDDGSSDNTKERLSRWSHRIRYVHQAKGGVSKARNRGIQEAKGDLIAFLDADDQWLPEKLSEQWQCLRAHPDAGLVHTDVFHVHEPAGERTYVYRARERLSGCCYTEFFWGNCLTTSTVLVTRSCIQEIGTFDERIRGASTEDLDLWLRIARRYPLAYVRKPLALYRYHGANNSLNRRAMLQDEFYVLSKALQADPSLWKQLGAARICRRMADLASQAGNANLDAGDARMAHWYFRAARSYAPCHSHLSPRTRRDAFPSPALDNSRVEAHGAEC